MVKMILASCFCLFVTQDETLNVASTLIHPAAGEFIELVDDQRDEVRKLFREHEKELRKVKRGSLSLDEKNSQISKLKEDLEKGMREVLLPQQIDRLGFFPFYELIFTQGFAHTLIHGSFASHMELSEDERREIAKAAQKASELYKKEVAIAQKKAISTIIKSIPDVKRKKLDKVLSSLVKGDGTIWNIDLRMLEPSRREALEGVILLPPFSKDSKAIK